MKMKPVHFNVLKNALACLREDNIDVREQYKQRGLSDMRMRWDLLHKVEDTNILPELFVCNQLYPYLNDTHIDTALRKIVDELWPVT